MGVAGLRAGKRALVMGVANDHSIAGGIARKLAEAGAEIAFTYQGDALKKRVALIGEGECGPVRGACLCDAPRDRPVIGNAENQALLASHQALTNRHENYSA